MVYLGSPDSRGNLLEQFWNISYLLVIYTPNYLNIVPLFKKKDLDKNSPLKQ